MPRESLWRARIGTEAVVALRETATDTESRQALVEALQALSRRYPRSLGLRRAIAEVQGDLGRPAEAVPIYRALLRETPLDAELRVALAAALEKAGKREEALEEYQHALKLDGGLAAAREGVERLGELRVELPADQRPSWLKPTEEEK